MLKNKLFTIFTLLSISTLFSQTSLNSPYSRFGIGNIVHQTNAMSAGMAGEGTSYSSFRNINTINPALLNTTKYTTFEFGVGYGSLNVNENGKVNTSRNFNFDYFNIAMPLHRKYVLGIGLRPFSQVNYNTFSFEDIDDETSVKNTYDGSGGVTSMHFTNSYSVIKDTIRNTTFSFGLDAAFLAGNTKQSNEALLSTNGNEDASYTSILNTNIYRGFKFNLGTSYRKELFVGNDFETIKSSKCNESLLGTVTSVPNLFYTDRIAPRAKKGVKTTYTVIYPGASLIKISKNIKNGERRESIYNYYASFIKSGFGVLVLDDAEGISFNDLKTDYLSTYDSIKDIEPEYVIYENAELYSKEYLSYGSGIFFNAGASYELATNLDVTQKEEVTRVQTATNDPFENYEINETTNEVLLPSILRFGISIDKPNQFGKNLCGQPKKSTWVAGLDFTMYDWSSYRFLGSDLSLSNTFRIGLGGEITPNSGNRALKSPTNVNRLLNRINYRAGVYYQSLPFTYNSNPVSEVGINIGLTIPANNNGSLITWTFGFATRGSELKENYFKTGLGLTLNERGWFQKARIGL